MLIIHDPSQDTTDLGKCTQYLTQYETTSLQPPLRHYQLVILGGLSGRLDQTLHTIHAITRLATDQKERTGTWVVGRESIACVLGAVRDTLCCFPNVDTHPHSCIGIASTYDTAHTLWHHLCCPADWRRGASDDERFAMEFDERSLQVATKAFSTEAFTY